MLTKGQHFTLHGTPWKVAYVNYSRAHCVSQAVRVVTVTDSKTGRERSFTAHETRTMDISPDSQIDLANSYHR